MRSSWSSSEEALDACEGLIFNVPLEGSTRCIPEVEEAGALANVSSHVGWKAPFFWRGS